jgi:type II secretory pathway component GspD/PulD (secretin)
VSAAAHAAEAQAPLAPGRLPSLPLTQLDDRTSSADLDNRIFTLTFAQPVAIRDLLLQVVHGTSLSVVPDPGFTGTFIGELKNVTVRQALGLVLPPLDLDYAVDGSIVRVFRREPETRLFDINYVAASRTGAALVGAPDDGGTFARVSTTTNADVFADLTAGVRTLLSGRGTFNIDRKAGLLQVSDFPERLERVSLYLDAVHDRVHRQVQIDARVIEVELNDPETRSLDWELLARSSVQAAGVPGSSRPAINGRRVSDVSRFMTALAAQGIVSLLANPRILVLNNEPAVIRAGSDGGGSRGHNRSSEPDVTLAVTPQIAEGGVIMLSMSPIVSLHTVDPEGKLPAGSVYRETDTLARVADGETIVIAGFTRDHEVRERRVGVTGGWFGRSTVVTRKRIELMILLTPRIQ